MMESNGNQSTQGVRNSLIGLGNHIQSRAVVGEETGKAKTGHQVLRKGCGWHVVGLYVLYTVGANKRF